MLRSCRADRRAFTLIELMIVVAIIGVLAAMAVYGVRKYIAGAKSAEARNALGRLGKDAVSAYTRENMPGAVVSVDQVAQITNRFCPPAAPVPATVPSAEKYQSSPSAWTSDPGWNCLRFSMQDPQYYQYSYTTEGTGAPGDTVSGQAIGNLDGDADLATFTITGMVQSGSLTLAPTLSEVNPEE